MLNCFDHFGLVDIYVMKGVSFTIKEMVLAVKQAANSSMKCLVDP